MSRPLLIAFVTLVTLPCLNAQKLLGARDDAGLAQRLGSGVAWAVADPALLREGNRNAEARKLLRENQKAVKAFDRRKALATAREKAAAEKKLVLWYVPRIDGRQMYRPALPDLYMKAVLFSDPDCVALLNRRFVPVRLNCDKPLQELTGITAPETVEPVLVFMKPDGTIVKQVGSIRSFNAWWFDDLMRSVLNRHPELSGGRSDPGPLLEKGGHLAVARELYLEGRLAEAAASLARDLGGMDAAQQARAHYLMARIVRRLGKPRQALQELEQAGKALAQAAPAKQPARRRRARRGGLADDIACERGRCLLFQKDLEGARTALIACRAGPRRPEAFFHLGLVEWLLGSDDRARRSWKMAVHASADDPFSWKAACNLVDGPDLTPLGPTMHGFEDPFPPRRPATAVRDSAAPVARDGLRILARGALDVLLRLQRDHGGWTDGRYAYWGSPDLTPNVWVAATATACSALLDWRDLDPKAVDEALARGERYMFDERHMARGYNEEIYAEGYKLQYLVRKHDAQRERSARVAVRERMNAVVQNLQRLQNERGFWAHEYPNAFCTASVLSALEQAKKRGARIPQAMLELGARALLSTRGKDGGYPYGSGPRASSPKDSMGRMPICEATILGAGLKEGTQERLAAAMDNFWKHLPRLMRVRKCDFHTDGELAGFFFWHALYHTAEAIDAMPADSRQRNQQRLLGVLLELGEFDGSFIDSHEFGKAYGTSMGLLTLKKVLGIKNP